MIKDGSTGDGANRNSVLWKPHLYTINFKYSFICNSCAKVKSQFVDMIYELLRNEFKQPVGLGRSERIIPVDTARDMLASFFIMLCRNPEFDTMGIYTQIKENLLYPVFDSMCKDEDVETVDVETNEGKEYADELMTGIWYSELYKMFFKNTGGFYHNVVQFALSGCQMILFEACDNAGFFITSDNPAFEHKSAVVERDNGSGLVFPISPKYLVFVAKGDEGINVVDHRLQMQKLLKSSIE
ncbi:DUF4238 domain-containing protein [Guggenheimella bovis]